MDLQVEPVAEFTDAERSALIALRHAVYPPEDADALSSQGIEWAPPQHGVLIRDDAGDIVSYVGIVVREARLDGAPVRIGGIGSVKTHPSARGRGHATAGILRATSWLLEDQGVTFSLLVCRDALVPYYAGLGWVEFAGELRVAQPAGPMTFTANRVMTLAGLGPAPRLGLIDLEGMPW